LTLNDQEFKLVTQRWDIVLRLGLSAFKYGTIAFLGWRLSVVMIAYAGKDTFAGMALNVVADLKANTVFSHLVMGIFGLSGAAYGIRERSIKRREVRLLGSRVVQLEKRLDAKRSSSGLVDNGTSRPEDEP